MANIPDEGVIPGRFEQRRKQSVPQAVTEEMLMGAPPEQEAPKRRRAAKKEEERDFAGRDMAELDELERIHLQGEGQEEVQPPKPKEEDNQSFASIGKPKKKAWELTDEGAIIYGPTEEDNQEFFFKLLNNGELLECEVERRKNLGGALFPPIISQSGDMVADSMNEVSLMIAILRRSIMAPENFVAELLQGYELDFIEQMIPVYRAYQEWRDRELENARKKQKKIGKSFAS